MNSSLCTGQCEICKCRYDTEKLLQTSNNIFYCKDCFKRRLCSANKNFEAGDSRRQLLSSQQSLRIRSQKMFPCPEMYIKTYDFQEKIDLPGRIISSTSLSKRPIQCPKADCNKFISIFTLESHFRHEHKEVPTVATHLDARCATEFYPRDVRYSTIQCSVLLKVIQSDYFNTYHSSKASLHQEDQVPIMVLLATRVPAFFLMQNESITDDEESENSFDSAKTVVVQEANELFRPGDKIIVWLASNVSTNMNYTVAVSTLDNEIRQKYFGPLLTLTPSPQEICQDGNCLILTDIHCARMTENGTKPLALDVVMHGPD